MSIPPGHVPPATGATASQRRWRVGAMTLVLLLAATVSLVIVNLLAARYPVRWDVTLTGEHRLSPRTAAVLAKLRAPHEIVVAGPLRDRAAIDPLARQRTEDVIAQL